MQRILGQSHAVDTLTSALRSGRFHHAWIFSGPRGVGKFTAAVEVARLLLDPEASMDAAGVPSIDPLGRSSRLIDAGTHPDLHVIRKELAAFSDDADLRGKKQINIPIDLLRERMIGGRSGEQFVDAPAYRTAVLGHGKVFIIDEAELIDWNGQNSLLKTLEEPPPQTYMFLITTRPDRLTATVRSRCHHVRFGPLDERAMRQWLATTDAASRPPEALAWVVKFADGSPGVALLALEYGFHEWDQRLRPMLDELSRGDFPPALGETLGELVEDFATRWVKAHGPAASKDAANKDGCRHLLALLSSHARQQLAEALGDGRDPEQWLRAIDLIALAERQLESNVNLKLLLENLAVQWADRSALPAGA